MRLAGAFQESLSEASPERLIPVRVSAVAVLLLRNGAAVGTDQDSNKQTTWWQLEAE